jgi:hypothetical protein
VNIDLITIERRDDGCWEAIFWTSRRGRAVKLATGVGKSDQAALQSAKGVLRHGSKQGA